jgi:hypothetical protein
MLITTSAPNPLVVADERGLEQRRIARRLDVDSIRSVHTFYEEDGRMSLVFKGRAWRNVAIDAASLADRATREGVARLVASLRARGARVAAGVDELLSPNPTAH